MTQLVSIALVVLATAPISEEQDWPRTFTTPQGTASVYTPQLEALKGDQLKARAAVSWEPKDGEQAFGVAFFDATIEVDRAARLVEVRSVKVTKLRFPGLTPEREAKASERLGAEMSAWDLSFPLDTMLASLELADREKSTPGLKSAPPKIVVATEPTVLVPIDGEPKLSQVEGTSLMRVLNTPCLLVLDPADKRYFLTSGAAWFAAPELKGPWSPVDAPTTAVLDWYARNPPPPPPADEPPATPPAIRVVTEPTELLQFAGKPEWTPITGVGLLAASNTDSDLYLEVATQEYFLVLSGRWFTAKSLDGPWSAVAPDKLPKEFANIPPESGEGHVLAFVAGTPQAADALADTQVPTTSTVRRDAGKDLVVTWDGEPKFKAIEGTKLSYGVNTSFSVLLVSGRYWVCHQAVWYAAPSPKGPWVVADTRPPGIDGIPPSAPVYNVKYVYVYDVRPDVIVVGYLPGYVGVYPYGGVVVYGTGYYYAPYVSPVVYVARPATFGMHVTYNPWTGWGVGVSYGTPFIRVGVHFGAPPGYWGPPGYRPVPPPYYRPGYPPPAYRPPPGYPPGHRPIGGVPPGGRPPPPVTGLPPGGRPPPPTGALPPGGRPPPGQGVPPGTRPPGGGAPPPPSTLPAQRPPAPSTLPSNIYQRPANADRNAPRPSTQPVPPASVGGRPNDVYGSPSGDVYRRGNGGWEQRSGGGWTPAAQPAQPSAKPKQPSAPPQQLNRDYGARQHGSMGAPRGGGRRR